MFPDRLYKEEVPGLARSGSHSERARRIFNHLKTTYPDSYWLVTVYNDIWTFERHIVGGSYFDKFHYHGVNIVVSRYPKYRARAPKVKISDIVNEVYTGTRISKRNRSGTDEPSHFRNETPLSADEPPLSLVPPVTTQVPDTHRDRRNGTVEVSSLAEESSHFVEEPSQFPDNSPMSPLPPNTTQVSDTPRDRRDGTVEVSSLAEEPSYFANEPPQYPDYSPMSPLPPTTTQTMDVPRDRGRRACGSGPELTTRTDNAREAYRILAARFGAHGVNFHVIQVIKMFETVTKSLGAWGANINVDECTVSLSYITSVPSKNFYYRVFKDFAVLIIAPGD